MFTILELEVNEFNMPILTIMPELQIFVLEWYNNNDLPLPAQIRRINLLQAFLSSPNASQALLSFVIDPLDALNIPLSRFAWIFSQGFIYIQIAELPVNQWYIQLGAISKAILVANAIGHPDFAHLLPNQLDMLNDVVAHQVLDPFNPIHVAMFIISFLLITTHV